MKTRVFFAILVLCMMFVMMLGNPSTYAAQTTVASEEVSYLIVKGDTLSRIARKFHTKMELIQERNGIKNPDKIYWGRTIIIPPSTLADQAAIPDSAEKNEGEIVAPQEKQLINDTSALNAVLREDIATPNTPYEIAKQAEQSKVYIEINGVLVPVPKQDRDTPPALPQQEIPKELPPPISDRDVPLKKTLPPEIPPGNVVPERKRQSSNSNGLIVLAVYIHEKWESNISNFQKCNNKEEVEK